MIWRCKRKWILLTKQYLNFNSAYFVLNKLPSGIVWCWALIGKTENWTLIHQKQVALIYSHIFITPLFSLLSYKYSPFPAISQYPSRVISPACSYFLPYEKRINKQSTLPTQVSIYSSLYLYLMHNFFFF